MTRASLTLPDPSHVVKVLRDNEQSGTHLLSMGDEFLAYITLVELRDQPDSGLVKKDVEGTDKQDDGAAIRLFHSNALSACLSGDSLQPQFRFAFILHFMFGTYF